ncbi:sialidase-1-like [Branchiostoma floridae]|uniref:Sialidase-1 n=1 Tax=Branchiostoma floridae TaxID=7739 RepID=A0A9J7LMG4_BRAFL|nr:sialidase-1-like [Branchiostoma floridae]XP_035684465.1 sialidase-1-like [Branchiostoma floridae]
MLRLLHRSKHVRRLGLLIVLAVVALVWSQYPTFRGTELHVTEGPQVVRLHTQNTSTEYPSTGLRLSKVQDFVLWRSYRKGEIPVFRVPVLTYTPGGNLVAITEGRRRSHVDHVPKVIAFRRSTDGGTTWSPSKWIVDDGDATYRNCSYIGTVFVDDTTTTIFLMYVFCEFCPTRSLMLMNSTDDGITWGRPRNITDQVGKHYVTHPSPGYGIQKKHSPSKGRLIVCGHGFHDGKGLVLLLSDDHGVTWRHGAFVPSVPFQNSTLTDGNFNPDECQPVELPDGSLYLVVRNQHQYKCHCKMIMRSFDGGETLPRDHMFLDMALVEPRITSGVWYHNGVLFYSGPNRPLAREDLYLRWSHNHGHTWTKGLRIWDDLAGYSVITMVPNDHEHLYMIYERGTVKYFDEIALVKLKFSVTIKNDTSLRVDVNPQKLSYPGTPNLKWN